MAGIAFHDDDDRWMPLAEGMERLLQYNQRVSRSYTKRLNAECLIRSVYGVTENNGIITAEELREVKEECGRYMRENPEDKGFLPFYAHCALSLLVYEEEDPLEAKKLVQEIVREGREDDFLDYIRREDGSQDNFRENDFYLGNVTVALKMIREIKGENTGEA